MINVPLYSLKNELNQKQLQNHGIGVALALIQMAKDQLHWAKDLIVVFTEHGRAGTECWIEANFGSLRRCFLESSLELKAHSPQTGLVLDFDNDQFTAVNLLMEVIFNLKSFQKFSEFFCTFSKVLKTTKVI